MKRYDDEIKTVIKRMIENEEIKFKIDLETFEGWGKIELTVSFDNRCVQRSEINLADIRR